MHQDDTKASVCPRVRSVLTFQWGILTYERSVPGKLQLSRQIQDRLRACATESATARSSRRYHGRPKLVTESSLQEAHELGNFK